MNWPEGVNDLKHVLLATIPWPSSNRGWLWFNRVSAELVEGQAMIFR